MSIEQMRVAVTKAYSGFFWAEKVEKMSDKQVAATYMRLLNTKQL